MSNELRKILYVEDEPCIQEIAVVSLEDIGGFEIKVCNTGKEALDAIDDFEPDIVLSDVMMPEMDGPTLLKHMQENPKYSHIPIIFMTAKAQVHEVEEYIGLGAIKVILKPFSPLTLPEEIKETWAEFIACSA